MKVAKVALVVLVVILLVLLSAKAAAARVKSTYLCGMWVGNPEFLERAQLTDMQLYVAPGGKKRAGYLIMVDRVGGYLANEAVALRVTKGGSRVSIAPADGDHKLPLHGALESKVCVMQGTLVLKARGEIVALLDKDHAATAVANAA
jgi:hypothetical protein